MARPLDACGPQQRTEALGRGNVAEVGDILSVHIPVTIGGRWRCGHGFKPGTNFEVSPALIVGITVFVRMHFDGIQCCIETINRCDLTLLAQECLRIMADSDQLVLNSLSFSAKGLCRLVDCLCTDPNQSQGLVQITSVGEGQMSAC